MRRIALVALLLLALAGYLATSITLVRPGERAVVRRFGRVLKTKPAPGLFIGLPWGMDRVDRVPVHKVQQLEIGYRPGDAEATDRSGLNIPGQLVTGDHNLVNVRVAIDYAVDPDEDQIVKYVLHADRAEGLVARTAESALAEWVADRRIDDILIRGQAELPGWLVQEIQNRLNAYQIGVRVQGASVPLLQPPDEVQLAFTAVNDAQLSISTKERIASRVAAERLAEAEAEKYRLEQDSRAYAREQRLRAQADGDAFLKRLAQYQTSASRRGDFLVRMWWDEMGKLFSRMKQNGQLDLLDNHLGPDGLDITHTPALPRRK